MSETNKKNAAKKKLHHRTGSGGYHKAQPLWGKAQRDLIEKGIRPETYLWSPRGKNWFFGAGGSLDPETGKLVWNNKKMDATVEKLRDLFAKSAKGTFVPDRENNEITEALGNPEHPGRTRGTSGSVPWKYGFPDAGGYRSRERKRKKEVSLMEQLNARVKVLEEAHRVDEATQEATPPSQRRSSVASTELELVVAQPELTAPTSYPVDAITENQDCQLLAKFGHLTPKAAIGTVRPPRPEGTFHCSPIPQGYAVVMVDEIHEGYEKLELDYPTGEGENRLSQALKTPCLWRKELIRLSSWTACDHQVPHSSLPPSSSAPTRRISPLSSPPSPAPINPPAPPPPSPAPVHPPAPPPPSPAPINP